MPRPRKKPVEQQNSIVKKNPIEKLEFVDLVEIVRRSRSKQKINTAYAEIEKRMKTKLKQIVFKFHIPGMGNDDIYQEALFALRYKAIKDYDKERGNDTGPYPFHKFAILCIRRHLSTNLKASYQNKKRVLNQSLSLDQERRDSNSGESMHLGDILAIDDGGTILELIESNEYYRTLFQKLFQKLSEFEKQVFIYYAQRYSYEEIAERINKKRALLKIEVINVKSVDNALSRIKSKGQSIFLKFG